MMACSAMSAGHSGRRSPADRSIQSDALVAKLKARGVAAELAESYDELGAVLAREARAGDTILTMGARDPQLPVFAREMAARTADR